MAINEVSSEDFALHDAEIVSIGMDRGTSVSRIGLSRVTGQRCTVELFGVKAFRAEDFVLQNVVSRMLRSTAKQFSAEEIDFWMTWATSFSDTDSWLKPDSRHQWLAAFDEGSLELVVFEPSIGAQIAVVCERLLFRPCESQVVRADSIQYRKATMRAFELVQIEIRLSSFYSLGDERRFFKALMETAAIKNVNGVGRGLSLDVDLRYLSREAVLDMIALFWRYGNVLAPLQVLAIRKRFAWLSDKRAYWYKSMFGKSSVV